MGAVSLAPAARREASPAVAGVARDLVMDTVESYRVGQEQGATGMMQEIERRCRGRWESILLQLGLAPRRVAVEVVPSERPRATG